jgi:hypothetical protein
MDIGEMKNILYWASCLGVVHEEWRSAIFRTNAPQSSLTRHILEPTIQGYRQLMDTYVFRLNTFIGPMARKVVMKWRGLIFRRTPTKETIPGQTLAVEQDIGIPIGDLYRVIHHACQIGKFSTRLAKQDGWMTELKARHHMTPQLEYHTSSLDTLLSKRAPVGNQ